jgi:hypothetical protein
MLVCDHADSARPDISCLQMSARMLRPNLVSESYGNSGRRILDYSAPLKGIWLGVVMRDLRWTLHAMPPLKVHVKRLWGLKTHLCSRYLVFGSLQRLARDIVEDVRIGRRNAETRI